MKPLTEPTRYSCTERTQGDPASAAAATGLVQPIRTPPPATATFITRRDRAPARVRYIGLQTTGSHDPWQSPAKPCALEPPLGAAIGILLVAHGEAQNRAFRGAEDLGVGGLRSRRSPRA